MSESQETPAPAEGYEQFWRVVEDPRAAARRVEVDPTATAYERFTAAVEE
jgi:hypothetical protein